MLQGLTRRLFMRSAALAGALLPPVAIAKLTGGSARAAENDGHGAHGSAG